MENADITQYTILEGLLGKSTEIQGQLWINPKNYLSASLYPVQGSKPYSVSYIDLFKKVNDSEIDLLKIDIEGGEYEFIESNLDFLKKTQTLFIEIHPHPSYSSKQLTQLLESINLIQIQNEIKCAENHLMIFKRSE